MSAPTRNVGRTVRRAAFAANAAAVVAIVASVGADSRKPTTTAAVGILGAVTLANLYLRIGKEN